MLKISSKFLPKTWLTSETHYSTKAQQVFEMFQETPGKPLKFKPGTTGKGLEHVISSWTDDKTERDTNGNYLDIVLLSANNTIVWCPYIEYLLIKTTLKQFNPNILLFGYIDKIGLSDSDKYTFWIEIQ